MKPEARPINTLERIASENAKPVRHLGRHTGWLRLPDQNNDSVTLVSYDGGLAVPFKSEDPTSGTASVRMNAEAYAYAIDNPYRLFDVAMTMEDGHKVTWSGSAEDLLHAEGLAIAEHANQDHGQVYSTDSVTARDPELVDATCAMSPR